MTKSEARSQSRRQRLTALLILLLGVLFALQFRWAREETTLGWQAEAKMNPFAAAEYFLKAQGKAVQTRRGRELFTALPANADSKSELLSENALIFISSTRYPLESESIDRLLMWIENGGHLVAAAQQYWNEDEHLNTDTLFNVFEVEVRDRAPSSACYADPDAPPYELSEKAESNELEKASAGSNDKNEKEGKDEVSDWYDEIERCSRRKRSDASYHCIEEVEEALAYMQLTQSGEMGAAYFSGMVHLQDHSEAGSTPIANEFGNQLVQFQYGKGLVTLLSEDDLWRNDGIDWFDHAYILAQLSSDREQIWLIQNMSGGAHWTVLFWQTAWPLISSFGVWLLFYIWKRGQRFGPIRTETVAAGRAIVEHIEAGSQFYWKRLSGGPLLKALQEEVIHLLRRRRWGGELAHESGLIGVPLNSENAQAYDRLAALVSTPERLLSGAQVAQAITATAENPLTEAEFFDTVTLLKQMRDQL